MPKSYPRQDVQSLVVKELQENREHIATLARLSGVSYRYILTVADGKIKNPAYRRVAHLASFLGIDVTSKPCKHLLKEQVQ